MTALTVSLAPAPATTAAGAATTRAVAKLTAIRSLPIDRASPRFSERHDPADESALAELFGAATVDKFPEDDDDEADVIDPRMMFLDPTQWKEQDHYFVLGLQDARFQATDAEIKTAYRRRVLQYHPDNDATFKCIQKAHEILADPVKCMQYDSVDPAIDFTIPSDAEIKSWIESDGPDAIYTHLAPIFARETDTARVRTLVDLALKHDARMKRFKEEDKLAKKMKKQQAAQGGSATPTPVSPSTSEPAAATEPAVEQAAAAAAADKDRKAAVKRERKAIKHLVTREANYLLPASATASADDMTRISAALDQLLDACKDDAQELKNVRVRLAAALAKDLPESRATVKAAFDAECERATTAREQDRSAATSGSAAPAAALPSSKVVPWSAKELQMLIAGVNAIPGGTVARWEQIAEYVAEHSDNPKVRRTADVIAMAKRVQGRPATAAAAAAATWSLAQQEHLQKALRSYPPSYKEADRFDKIAGMVEGKSKKECMARIKYLAEQVKLKKLQQQQQAAQQGDK
ncbi:hypothetical protein AMAG_07146 [Allomyces macrogynus ATCC 38327]|uniref:J domain-containing protein n=1 Tax=Allomyces macrogynus (strain ATCC 38327) TaxID=578462 RepID=A0A0L0SHE9_ALLM3|nr:hypothetical protein AMAG_07146 [Allomyces macrogynus ATCC 38327]|eukprot:KNE61874.1 hypothetical protein AMAG_07146 [Allomyces macrogynus ATCC 38327]